MPREIDLTREAVGRAGGSGGDSHDDEQDPPSNVLWLSVLISFVLTPHPALGARLSPTLTGRGGDRIRRQGGETKRFDARPVTVALHVRHGDKSMEPWRAPWLPLRAYLRRAAAALEGDTLSYPRS